METWEGAGVRCDLSYTMIQQNTNKKQAFVTSSGFPACFWSHTMGHLYFMLISNDTKNIQYVFYHPRIDVDKGNQC